MHTSLSQGHARHVPTGPPVPPRCGLTLQVGAAEVSPRCRDKHRFKQDAIDGGRSSTETLLPQHEGALPAAGRRPQTDTMLHVFSRYLRGRLGECYC